MKSSRRVIKSDEVHWGAAITFRPPVVTLPLDNASAPTGSQAEPGGAARPLFHRPVVAAGELPGPDGYGRSLVQEAEAEKERLLEAARGEAAEIERLAQARAAEITQSATAQSEQAVRTAQEQAADVTSRARREGYEAAEADAGQLLLAAQGVLDEVRAWRTTLFAQSEQSVLDLVARIAQNILGQGVTLEREALEAAFGRAVTEARPLGNLRVRVHPDDAALLSPAWAQQAAPTGQHLELVPDDTIRRGGCLVEGEAGMVDARLDTQLQLTVKALEAAPAPETPEEAGEAAA